MGSTLIKPIGIEHHKYPLSGLDLMFGFSYTDTVRFLSKDYDISVLESALQKTVNHIPVLAGKVVRENGMLLIDTDGNGVQLSFDSVGYPAPIVEDGILADSADVFLNPMPSITDGNISELPLLSIKVTSFGDGIKSIGMRLNHIGMDGAAAFMFFRTWMSCIQGKELKPLTFSRDPITAFAKHGVSVPSAQSGIPTIENEVLSPAPVFFRCEFHNIHIPSASFARLQDVARIQLESDISINDLLHALVFKAFALSSEMADDELARTNLSYNLRFVKGIDLPPNFFGSAILFRCLELSFGELRTIDIVSLARRFKQLTEPNPEICMQDVGFYQAQYEQGRYNRFGVFSNFTTVLGNGGLYLNNALPLVNAAPAEINFDGHLIRSEVVLPRAFSVRLAMLIPSMKEDVVLRLALESYQILEFEKSWSALLAQILQGATPAAV